MTENENYEPPALTEIGTLHELTLQKNNKIGSASDKFSSLGLVGSLVQAP